MAPTTRTRSDGSARASVAPPREESAIEGWLRNLRLSGFTVFMLALVVVAVVVLAPSLRILIEQRAQIAELQKSVDDAGAAVDELTTEVARWDDPAYIEAQARERLYYVFPGDVSYLVIGDTATDTPSVDGLPISNQIQSTHVDWMSGLLSSLYTAGLTTAPPDELTGP